MTALTAGLALGLAPAAAVASPHPLVPRDFTNNEYCNNGAPLCEYNDGGNGDDVYGKGLHTDWFNEKIDLTQFSTTCGNGYVTYNSGNNTGCPFTKPAFDKAFMGDEIVKDSRHGSGGCFVGGESAFGSVVKQDSSCGTGKEWVRHPQRQRASRLHRRSRDLGRRHDPFITRTYSSIKGSSMLSVRAPRQASGGRRRR
jgi:hypothetical protein